MVEGSRLNTRRSASRTSSDDVVGGTTAVPEAISIEMDRNKWRQIIGFSGWHALFSQQEEQDCVMDE